MSITGSIIMLAIGAVAGWLAGLIMKNAGFGLIGNIIVGILGAFVGGWALGLFGISLAVGTLGMIIQATLGAVILLFVIGLVKR
jgi:uncharacterized membrane protein YeaQ/YmgE (transglycosylase-associated protein family)